MNNEEQKKVDIKERILQDIKSGELEMRPKFYFTLKVATLIFVAFAIVVISVFILNFILFSIRINSHEALLSFGPRGWGAFLHFFPWAMLLVDIGLVAGLVGLMRQFKIGYKIPVLNLLAGLFIITVFAGFALDRGTAFNDRIYEREGRGLPPPIGEMYRKAHHEMPVGSGICLCTVLEISGNTLTVQDTRNGTSTLTIVLPMNDIHATTTNLNVGDMVLIAGDEDDGIIQAFGIKKGPRDDMRVKIIVPE